MNSQVQTCLCISMSYLYQAAIRCQETGEQWTQKMDEAHRQLWQTVFPERTEEERRKNLGITPSE